MRKWTIMLTAVTAAAVVLTGCGSSNNGGNAANNGANDSSGNSSNTSTKNSDTKSGDKVTIRTSITDGELSKDQIAEFEKEHPNIHVVIETIDSTKLAAQLATGDAPDVIRISGVQELPNYVIKGIAADLTDRINTSTVFKADDLLPITNVYRFDGKTVGTGPIYGLPKDWSNDYAIFYNKKVFDAAGVPLPDATKPLTIPELIDLAKKLTIKDGDKVKQYGLGNHDMGKVEPFYDTLLQYLLSAGVDINNDDFSKMDFDKPEVRDYITMWVDAVKSNIGPNSVNNDQTDSGDLFFKNQAAMMVMGYWYSGVIRGDERAKSHIEDFGMLPTPMAPNGTRVAPTGSATGAIINKASKHPDEAWTFFEWYFGGKPADDRAKSGWGLPIFQSKMDLLPKETAFDKQVNTVLQDELNYTSQYLKVNPYLSSGGGSIFNKYVNPLFFGKSSLDDAIKGMTKDANSAIEEAMAAAGQ
ncbi:ABC transporter substrate-binding protein [Paenibacillus sacheonensis]|uniref:Extracellular solute-binding protein n=1 Tax=Paenibacillus sacheonensis TaxID=742054 RepID=A0A7X4YLL7_9BACL|nr:sugar ABC transporter substrate-binding protein [Paenibacillus sacheonensis]MBM7566083.1 multiple sugar transport system substrate-binding protein [Paenibacillus sacheonensis]NBC68608.1 extracellular solute-binding protein [Paenibacillus sacheonensis]